MLHYPVMAHDRTSEISAEMSALLEQQSHLLNSSRTVSAMSAEDIEAYARRNNRLRQLCKQLTELK